MSGSLNIFFAIKGTDSVRANLVWTNIRVEGFHANAHFVVDAQLQVFRVYVVAREALALLDHDQDKTQIGLFLPPSKGSGSEVIVAACKLGFRVLVKNLVYQRPSAMLRCHVVALAGEAARLRQVDDLHYVHKPVERP